MDRILEAQPGVPSLIIGTVYMDMPLKPNVLSELAEDVRMYPFVSFDRIGSIISSLRRPAKNMDQTRTRLFWKTNLDVLF